MTEAPVRETWPHPQDSTKRKLLLQLIMRRRALLLVPKETKALFEKVILKHLLFLFYFKGTFYYFYLSL